MTDLSGKQHITNKAIPIGFGHFVYFNSLYFSLTVLGLAI